MVETSEKIGKFRIFLDQVYYLAYAGGKRQLPEKQQKEYDKLIHLPFALQRKELQKIPMENNPNVIPLKGRQLLSFIKELKFVPFFDHYFDKSHLLQLTDLIIFESIKQKSYEIALKGGF